MEVAEVAFKAVEFSHHHPLPHKTQHQEKSGDKNENKQSFEVKEKELEALRSENQRLKDLVEQKTTQRFTSTESQTPSEHIRIAMLIGGLPPDLHSRIINTVESPKFLSQLKTFDNDTVDGIPCKFSFENGTGLQLDEILINVGCEEPSLWIWVTDEMVHGNLEEKSGIDNENYILINQEQVVDGIANFMRRCVLLNPKAKNLTPEEIQKSKFSPYARC